MTLTPEELTALAARFYPDATPAEIDLQVAAFHPSLPSWRPRRTVPETRHADAVRLAMANNRALTYSGEPR